MPSDLQSNKSDNDSMNDIGFSNKDNNNYLSNPNMSPFT